MRPDQLGSHRTFGGRYRTSPSGTIGRGEACYRRVLAAQPSHFEAYSNLGAALKGQGKVDEAVAAYREAIGIRPDYFRASLQPWQCA
jgi:protein O-GlcNAc transferase